MTVEAPHASPPCGDAYGGAVAATGSAATLLGEHELGEFLAAHLVRELAGARRVLVIVPDRTRVAPVADIATSLRRVLSGKLDRLDYLVALGTHAPLDVADRHDLVGLEAAGAAGEASVENHRFDAPGELAEIGALAASTLARASGGMLEVDVPVRINARVLDYDRILIVSPVLPHEVAGFSGGNKYLFPGVGGPELTDATHWLGALITSRRIIGRLGVSPVRAVIDAAAAMVPVPRSCLALVTAHAGGLHAAFLGAPEPAWAAAAAMSARIHVEVVEHPVERVVSVVPARYPDMWTAAKAMYKVEPVVADGGEVVVYAPHVREFSAAHRADLARVGYHVRDWHLARWDELSATPWRVLAHSTHLKGDGAYDPVAGERPRVRVTLATGIDRATCAAHGLAYADPAVIARELAGPPRPGTFVERDAGERLYRLANDG